MEWRTIDSAPKDGTEVLLYYPHVDTVIRGAYAPQNEGDWESGIQDWDDWTSDHDFIIQEDPSYAPTHWMPLPKPPVQPEKESGTQS